MSETKWKALSEVIGLELVMDRVQGVVGFDREISCEDRVRVRILPHDGGLLRCSYIYFSLLDIIRT